jgi:hypothetical protein
VFDNPLETEWPRPRPKPQKPRLWLVASVALACVALQWAGRSAPGAVLNVVSSPSHLRQVEVLSYGGQTAFYLHNAGFRLRHSRTLIGVVSGGGGWRVTWLGPDSVKIGFDRDWDRIVMGHADGVSVAFSEPS